MDAVACDGDFRRGAQRLLPDAAQIARRLGSLGGRDLPRRDASGDYGRHGLTGIAQPVLGEAH